MNCRGAIERDPESTHAQKREALEGNDEGNADDDDYAPHPKKRSRTKLKLKGRTV
jgi:hypothetical protein